MWRRERFILVALLATVVLVGSVACSSCAPGGAGDKELPTAPEDAGIPEDVAPPEGMVPPDGVPGAFSNEALLARVAEILGIDQQKLEDAFAQARSETADQGLWQRPANDNRGPRGANEE